MSSSNIFLFFGDDTYRIEQTLRVWKEKFCEKHGGDINVNEYDGEELTAQELKQAMLSAPFLGTKRLVIVRHALEKFGAEEQKHLPAILEEIPDFCILVFAEYTAPDRRTAAFKKIQKIGTIKEFPLLLGGQLLGWIFKKTEELGGSIAEGAALALADLVGGDLHRMENELKKLILYADGNPITIDLVQLLVDTTLTTSIFNLTDAIARRDMKTSLRELHALIESGEELPMILHMIIRQFRIIIQIKDLMEHERCSEMEIIQKLKLHPFVVKKTRPQIKNFTLPQLKEIYEALLTIDTGMKTGKIKTLTGDSRELTLALDRFVFSTCNS